MFEPLLPSTVAIPSDQAVTRLRVVSQPSSAEPFKPLLRPNAAPGPAVASHAAVCGHPVVTVQRDHDQVTQICIQCTCGQVIELACVY